MSYKKILRLINYCLCFDISFACYLLFSAKSSLSVYKRFFIDNSLLHIFTIVMFFGFFLIGTVVAFDDFENMYALNNLTLPPVDDTSLLLNEQEINQNSIKEEKTIFNVLSTVLVVLSFTVFIVCFSK